MHLDDSDLPFNASQKRTLQTLSTPRNVVPRPTIRLRDVKAEDWFDVGHAAGQKKGSK